MALESPIQRDGDMGFIGYASRINPVSLPAGMLQLSENMRLNRGVAVTRRGAKRLADDISPGQVPLTVPFVLNDAPDEPIVRSSYTGGIFSSALMRSPDEVNSMEVVVLAGPDRAFTYLTDGSLQFSAAWADGVIAVDSNENLETETGEEITIAKLPAELTYPTGATDEIIDPTDNVSMVQAFDRLYLLREADTSQPGFEQKYTAAAGITVSGTVATVNLLAHGYTADSRVRIEGSTSAAFDGHEYDIVANNLVTDSFEITVPTGTTPDASANIKVRRVKPPIYWSGDPTTGFVRTTAGIPDVGISYRRMRSAAWASYINGRLIVPDGKQNVMLSDIYDPDVFDPFWSSFRVGVGGDDKIMAVHAWVEGSFLVFCRKSIWLAEVNQFPSTDGSAFSIDTPVSKLTLLTDEVGCSARQTIATAGQFIYFLSDAGVYRLDSKLDLKLRGETLPLSDPIANQVANLNADLVENAVGLYFSNRYFLAVPLAGSTEDNNGVFIYNQLNEQWESQDIYGFGVANFVVSNLNNSRRIMISNRAGKLMLLGEIDAGDQSPDSQADVTTPVPGRIVTRRYSMGTMTSKRFTRVLADAVLPNTGAIRVTANLRNPDTNEVLVPGLTNDTGSGNDFSLKLPIRRKAHYAEITIETLAARPEIRNVSVEAALASRPQTDTKIAA
jgi:hypothetical protein